MNSPDSLKNLSSGVGVFARAKYTFKAHIIEDGRVTKKTAGKYTDQQDLDKFLAANWPGSMKYETVPAGKKTLTLKIWRYIGGRLDKQTVLAKTGKS